MSVVEILYTRASTLLRDIFHYVFGGLFLVALIGFGPAILDGREFLPNSIIDLVESSGQIAALVFFSGIVLLYMLGHLQLAIFRLIHPLLLRLFKRTSLIEELKHWETRVNQEASQALGGSKEVISYSSPHLFHEMTIFKTAPEIHARYIERYNTLSYVRAVLFVSVLSAAIFYPLWLRQPLQKVVIPLALIILSTLIYFLYVSTKIGFLERLSVSFAVDRLTTTTSSEEHSLYFAYGSNMSLTQMKTRCPSAKVYSRAILHGYVREYPRKSQRWMGGVAGLAPSRVRYVEGVLFSIAKHELDILDEFEGVEVGRYRREEREVELPSGRLVNAWVYNAVTTENEQILPTIDYVDTMMRGAKENNLSSTTIAEFERLQKEIMAG